MNSIKTELSNTLSRSYMLVTFSASKWGADNRIDRQATQQAQLDNHTIAGAVKLTKNLLAGANGELKAVNAAVDNFRAFVTSQTMPWTLADDGKRKRGPRLLSNLKVMDFMSRAQHFDAAFNTSLDELIDVYDDRVSDAIINLGGVGRIEDYPSASEVKRMFSVGLSYGQLPSVDGFGSMVGVPKEVLDSLSDTLVTTQDDMIANAMKDVRERMVKPVQRMVDQLSKDKTKLYPSLVGNLRDIAAAAEGFNLTGDTTLDAVREEIQDKLCQHDIEILRGNEGVKLEVLDAAKGILTTLAADTEDEPAPEPVVKPTPQPEAPSFDDLPDVDDLF